jgi:hypothetical protein
VAIPTRLENRADREILSSPEMEAACLQLKHENQYHSVVPINGEEYVAIRRLMFHWTVLYGLIWEKGLYEDNWCYVTLELAEQAVEEWKSREFQGEPTGWHRNPKTGRRRKDGDPTTEYIQH